jgi:hypothetical protein
MLEVIPLAIICGSFVGFIFLEIKAMKTYEGFWRPLAVLPLVALIAIVGSIVFGIRSDRTSHNLWPFEIVLWSIGSLVYLGMLHLIRKIVSAHRR